MQPNFLNFLTIAVCIISFFCMYLTVDHFSAKYDEAYMRLETAEPKVTVIRDTVIQVVHDTIEVTKTVKETTYLPSGSSQCLIGIPANHFENFVGNCDGEGCDDWEIGGRIFSVKTMETFCAGSIVHREGFDWCTGYWYLKIKEDFESSPDDKLQVL